MYRTPKDKLARVYEQMRRLQADLIGDIGPVLDALDTYVEQAGLDPREIHALSERLMPLSER